MMKAAKEAVDLGILVSDINANLKFYQQTLGLQSCCIIYISGFYLFFMFSQYTCILLVFGLLTGYQIRRIELP